MHGSASPATTQRRSFRSVTCRRWTCDACERPCRAVRYVVYSLLYLSYLSCGSGTRESSPTGACRRQERSRSVWAWHTAARSESDVRQYTIHGHAPYAHSTVQAGRHARQGREARPSGAISAAQPRVADTCGGKKLGGMAPYVTLRYVLPCHCQAAMHMGHGCLRVSRVPEFLVVQRNPESRYANEHASGAGVRPL